MNPLSAPLSGRLKALLAIALCLALVLGLVVFGRIVWPALFWPLYGLVIVAVLASPWRAVRLRLLGLAFLAGAGPVMGAVLAVQRGVLALAGMAPGLPGWIEANLLPWGGDFGAGIVAPVTEEILKILPLVWFLARVRRRGAPVVGPLDVALLGVALGAGFDFTETLFRTASAGGSLLGLDWDQHVGPHWGLLHLFPTLHTNLWGDKFCFSHPGWTGTVAVALGLAYWLGRRRPWARGLPWLAGLWAVWDHYLWNAFDGPSPRLEGSLLANLPAIDGHGQVMPYVFLVGLAAAAILSARAIRRLGKADPALAGLWRPSSWRSVSSLYAFVHTRRALAYGLYAFVQARRPGGLDGQAARVLSTLRAACVLSATRLTPTRGQASGRTAPGGGTAVGRREVLGGWFVGMAAGAGLAAVWLGHAAGGSRGLFALGNLSPEGLMAMLLLSLVFGVAAALCWPGLWWAGLAGLLAGLVAGGLINAAAEAVPSDLLWRVIEAYEAEP